MAMSSKIEQRERIIEVTKTKQEILQKMRKLFFPRSDSNTWRRWMNWSAEEIDAELLFLVMLWDIYNNNPKKKKISKKKISALYLSSKKKTF